jgi:hypothetical protein
MHGIGLNERQEEDQRSQGRERRDEDKGRGQEVRRLGVRGTMLRDEDLKGEPRGGAKKLRDEVFVEVLF